MKYWDRAWNPVSGCTACSEGCRNCIARRLIERRKAAEPNLTFDVRVNVRQLMKRFDGERETIMVASQGDLFHPGVSTDTIDKVMRKCHAVRDKRFLVLTRRSERLGEYLNDPGLIDRLRRYHRDFEFDNVAFGVSVESSEYVYRIRHLQGCPLALHKFVAFEPLLEDYDYCSHLDGIEWVVVGAETSDDGTARPCDVRWIESIVRGCDERGIGVFVNNIDTGNGVTDDFELFPESLRRDDRLFAD